jgi:hypothetical protein
MKGIEGDPLYICCMRSLMGDDKERAPDEVDAKVTGDTSNSW